MKAKSDRKCILLPLIAVSSIAGAVGVLVIVALLVGHV